VWLHGLLKRPRGVMPSEAKHLLCEDKADPQNAPPTGQRPALLRMTRYSERNSLQAFTPAGIYFCIFYHIQIQNTTFTLNMNG
jgi:hypothetical protein